VEEILEEERGSFYSPLSLVGRSGRYGVRRRITLYRTGRVFPTDAFVFRDPQAAARAIEDLRDELAGLAAAFDPDAPGRVPGLAFFKPWERSRKLELDERYFDRRCRDLGFFAFASNIRLPMEEALARYDLRVDAERIFRRMHASMARAARSPSAAESEGMMLALFIGLGLLTRLRALLKRPGGDGRPLIAEYRTAAGLLRELQPVAIVRDGSGARLVNVTEKRRRLVAALGFEGLLDDAGAVLDLLSARRLAEHLSGGRH
ncbi:MAG: hypothetical protein HUK26_09010, partial [Duodenibacillus sp.]|nr:hypothetical protein [Duodenibacillus sp.]